MSIAFFDVDGTLLPLPSLELRFFWNLLRRGKIPVANCFLWGATIFRRHAKEVLQAAQSNKTYLRGVHCDDVIGDLTTGLERWMPEFYPQAIQRVWLHALRGDSIVLVTGTLAPLARIVKLALERELLWRGVEIEIQVIATELSASAGCWTGSVLGAPMCGDAKAIAVKEFARNRAVLPARCSVYGDHLLDRPMFEALGRAFVVNPSSGLLRLARRKGWQVLRWGIKPHPINIVRPDFKWKGEAAR